MIAFIRNLSCGAAVLIAFSIASAVHADETGIADAFIVFMDEQNPADDKSVMFLSVFNNQCSDSKKLGLGNNANVLDDVELAQTRFQELDLTSLDSILDRASGTRYYEPIEQARDILRSLKQRALTNAKLWLASGGEGDDCSARDMPHADVYSGGWAYFSNKIGLYRAQLAVLLLEACGDTWKSSCAGSEHYSAAHLLISRKIALYCSLLDHHGVGSTACRSMLRAFDSSEAALDHYTELLTARSRSIVKRLRETRSSLRGKSCDEVRCDPETDFYTRWASGFLILAHQDGEFADKLEVAGFELSGDSEMHKEARMAGLTLLGRPYSLVWSGDGPDATGKALQLYSDL